MSQFGMQMPAGRVHRGSSPDIYTALVLIAVVFLAVAVGVMFTAGAKVSPGEGFMAPFSLQEEGQIKLPPARP